jgi:DNA ligase D
MPAAETTVDVAGRAVRVSSPDRVMYPATDTTPDATKADVARYYASVSEAMITALRERPTTLERWPKGVVEGIKLATRNNPKAEAFYQKRFPKGAPDFVEKATITFPSGRTADEVCPTEPAVMVWAAQIGTITFHPWPVRRDRPDHPDELRIDLDPQPGTDFADAVVAAHASRRLLEELGIRGFPKSSGNRGVHIYVRVEPRWEFVDVRHAAIAFARELERRMPDRVTSAWWKEERGERVFVDFNQNARDRTIASAYSLRPIPGAPVSTPLDWEELDGLDPRSLNLWTVPERVASGRDPHAEIDAVAHSLEPLLELYARDIERGMGDMPYPPDYPKMPGEPPRVQPSRINPLNWEDAGS